MNKIDWSGKSIFRKIIIVISAIQVLGFFLIPYATAGGALGGINDLANALGTDTGMPDRLTGFAAIKMFTSPYADSMLGDSSGAVTFYCTMFLLTLIVPLIVLLVNLFSKGKTGYVIKIITAVIMSLNYLAVWMVASTFEMVGYKSNPIGMLLCLSEVVMFVLAIVGLVKLKDETGNSAAGATVKQGKHDGTLTGIKGSYTGAAIPLKNGTAVFIGRDPKVCSVVIKGENVSRKHCSVTYDEKNNSYSVTDYSVNGVYDRRGRKLESGRVNLMAPGDEIHIGATDEVFRLG